jgi:hypothetical protein
LERDGSAKRSSGTAAVLAGGALVVLGSILTWAKLAMNMPGSGARVETLSGLDDGTGKVTLALGAIAVAVAVASLLVNRKGGLGIGLAVVSIAAGGFAAILGVMFAIDVRTHALDYAITQAGQKPAEYPGPARTILDQATAVTHGWGLYLVILGGVVAVIGGILTAIDVRASLLADASLGADEEIDHSMAGAETPTGSG